ncbi:hypothetical protein TNIN_44401 [Trichonephila inaurata madagascariensis]|uniref:Uncharacterized protein n=1 Tax=Trichonephila inaurata madagascariensis TaxID=2747483 RepID=A0A8X7C150_9ARAC|nr:hypothetical protein TNIN_44401 [Trichonephila inaurata madagascariensis]
MYASESSHDIARSPHSPLYGPKFGRSPRNYPPPVDIFERERERANLIFVTRAPEEEEYPEEDSGAWRELLHHQNLHPSSDVLIRPS